MHFKNALFKIVSKIQTLVFCAFFNKIAFGKSDEEKFEEKHHFEININEISEVFCALFYIVKAFSTLKDTTGTLLKKSDTTTLQTGCLPQKQCHKLYGNPSAKI